MNAKKSTTTRMPFRIEEVEEEEVMMGQKKKQKIVHATVKFKFGKVLKFNLTTSENHILGDARALPMQSFAWNEVTFDV